MPLRILTPLARQSANVNIFLSVLLELFDSLILVDILYVSELSVYFVFLILWDPLWKPYLHEKVVSIKIIIIVIINITIIIISVNYVRIFKAQ